MTLKKLQEVARQLRIDVSKTEVREYSRMVPSYRMYWPNRITTYPRTLERVHAALLHHLDTRIAMGLGARVVRAP